MNFAQNFSGTANDLTNGFGCNSANQVVSAADKGVNMGASTLAGVAGGLLGGLPGAAIGVGVAGLAADYFEVGDSFVDAVETKIDNLKRRPPAFSSELI